MVKRSYEIMVAFDPAYPAADVDQTLARLKQVIVDAGGEVKSADKHGVRKLAFKLKGKADALFCLIVCNAPSVIVKQVTDVVRMNEGVLRYMTTRSTLPVKPVAAAQTPPAAPVAPAVQTPAVQTPAAQTPAAQTPAAQTPAAQTPAAPAAQ